MDCASAYFFMYRKVTKNNIKTIHDDQIPQIITEILSKEEAEEKLEKEEDEIKRAKMRNSILPSV